MSIIDTHAHLYEKNVYKNIYELVKKLKDNNIYNVLLPGTILEDDIYIKYIVETFKDFFYPMLGIHPDYVSNEEDIYKSHIKEIEKKLSDYKYIAIGEVGLDYYGEKNNIKNQKRFINAILDIAINSKIPVSIHCREAFEDMLNILKSKVSKGLNGVIHCFTGNIDEAKKYIDLGFYLGIGGIVTFKNSKLKDVIKKIGMNNIVLETDSPYLSPEPLRGTVNDSSNLKYVVKKLAEILNFTEKDIEDITTKNSKFIFNLK